MPLPDAPAAAAAPNSGGAQGGTATNPPNNGAAPGVVAAPNAGTASSGISAAPNRTATAAAAPASSAIGGKTKWVWPTDRLSAPRPVPGGGVLLLGRLGQDVRAAGSGRVVYTGSGLRGYGNLIIIKHGDNLLSSYAHNRELLVHEGQEVTAGQVIGHMGTGPHQVCALYFEIRVNGKPTDPLHYLTSAR
jgi:lipoprotein NlpD